MQNSEKYSTLKNDFFEVTFLHNYDGNVMKTNKFKIILRRLLISLFLLFFILFFYDYTTRNNYYIKPGGVLEETLIDPGYSGVYYEGTSTAIVLNGLPQFLHIDVSSSMLGSEPSQFGGSSIINLKIKADSTAQTGKYKLVIVVSVPLYSGSKENVDLNSEKIHTYTIHKNIIVE